MFRKDDTGYCGLATVVLQSGVTMKVTRFVARVVSRFRGLKDDESGNVAVIFALALLPVVGLVGASVDYSHGNAVKASMQAAADATALNLLKSAASLNDTQLNQAATDSFNTQFQRPETQGLQISAQYSTEARSLTVTSAGSIKTDFMGVMGFSTLKIGARAVAVLKGEGTACVLSLNKTASGQPSLKGRRRST